MYDASLGRFCGRDPIGFKGAGENLYRGYFVLTRMDPSGLIPFNCRCRCVTASPYGSGSTKKQTIYTIDAANAGEAIKKCHDECAEGTSISMGGGTICSGEILTGFYSCTRKILKDGARDCREKCVIGTANGFSCCHHNLFVNAPDGIYEGGWGLTGNEGPGGLPTSEPPGRWLGRG
jgi:hypothetical protein